MLIHLTANYIARVFESAKNNLFMSAAQPTQAEYSLHLCYIWTSSVFLMSRHSAENIIQICHILVIHSFYSRKNTHILLR